MKTRLALSCGLLLSGCGVNLYSLPFFTSTSLHNRAALKFLKAGGPVEVGGPDLSIVAKDPYADGSMVMLTVSGGGMRASAFTLGVLAELDDLRKVGESDSAFEKVDLISSISGGSWAVAAVLADRTIHPGGPLSARTPFIEARYAGLANVKVRRWADHFIPDVTHDLTYSKVYHGGAERPLPFAYINATLFPSQSPFVFTQSYLTHYGVTSFGDPSAEDRVRLTRGLGDVPIGYAAAASGAVPGYTSAFAETALCQSARESYCFTNRAGGVRGHLQLMDGGLYDNIGYKTALEAGLKERERISRIPSTVIMIDTADGEAFQTMPDKGKDGSHMIALAKSASFPNQNATFDRLRKPAFTAAGFDRQILLDFAAAADFDPAQHGEHLDDLPELAYFAAHGVSCYAGDGTVLRGSRRLKPSAEQGSPGENLLILQGKSKDCLEMNFARVGYLHKTTFKYDRDIFRLRYQLGRLVVRMKQDLLGEAVFRAKRSALMPQAAADGGAK